MKYIKTNMFTMIRYSSMKMNSCLNNKSYIFQKYEMIQ